MTGSMGPYSKIVAFRDYDIALWKSQRAVECEGKLDPSAK